MLRAGLVGGLILLGACAEDPGTCNPTCGPDQRCEANACVPGGADGGPGDGGALDAAPTDGGLRQLSDLTISPTSATLVSTNGAQPTETFTVTATWSDGSSAPVLATMRVDPPILGTIDATAGVFTANGRFGGDGRLLATYGGRQAEATLRVELEATILAPGTSTAAPGLFLPTPVDDPARAALLVYPLDGVVMPQNVAPAEVQWNGGAPGDVFRVHLEKPSVRIDAYVTNDGPSFRDAYLYDQDGWRRAAQSEPDAPALLRVDRYEAASGQVILGAPIQLRFARAALLGSIYYWDIVAGRIVRINDGTTNRESFMPNPPLGCVGCHSVSSSGRYMAGRFGGGENVGSVFDLTQDLTANPPPTLFNYDTTNWWFSTFSPDDRRLLVTRDEPGAGGMGLLDPFTGLEIPLLEGALPTGRSTHPAWSPDGTAIAYVSNLNDWGGNNSTGDVYLLPVLGEDRLGLPDLLIAGTALPNPSPAGSAASYPSWTPDSSHLAFAHGSISRSETGASALYLVRRDGNNLVRLNRASGGPDAAHSFQPRFSPFQQGGYFWMSFLSRRDYGNAKAGTAGSGRQQIWVSALKEAPVPGEDPSEVPYWLPGQDTASLNISAYWAQRACRVESEACSVDAECCSGDCALDTAGGPSCAPLDPECKPLGSPCTDNIQCCDGVLCIGSTCGNL